MRAYIVTFEVRNPPAAKSCDAGTYMFDRYGS